MNHRELPETALIASAMAGERRAIARLLTLLDDAGANAAHVARTLARHAGRALVVGITGVPGSGKSTLINELLGAWLARGLKVAVIAVDPSSPISGGAVLGDRIRMGEHGKHPNAFIRSLSARGEMGGLSRTVRGAVDCFDAAGFERVIVETVGAGQSETAIASLADTRVVLCPPGLGDDVQAIKAGILEIADLLAVSKGDLPLAQETVREMREMLALRRAHANSLWKTRVIAVSAKESTGITELIEAIEAHGDMLGHGRRLKPRSAIIPTSEANSAAVHDVDEWREKLALVEREGICPTLGIKVSENEPGSAVVELTVDARHLDSNGCCHGGTLFAMSAVSFSLASHAQGRGELGIAASITFLSKARSGDRLLARTREIALDRHIGSYRIDIVRTGHGTEVPVASCVFPGISI